MKLSFEQIMIHYVEEGGHGIDHVRRVHRMAIWITRQVGADEDIVNASALLHDIARGRETRGECRCHAEEGTRMAGEILAHFNYDQASIERISYAIGVHRFSKGQKPESLEAAVLQDADRLDALGAICIARVFMYNGLHRLPLFDENRPPEKDYHGQHTTAINHFYEKILKIRPETFHTLPARKVAQRRYQLIEEFLEAFLSEWAGKDLK